MNLVSSDKASGNRRAARASYMALTVLSELAKVSNIAIINFFTVIEQESMSKPVFWHLIL